MALEINDQLAIPENELIERFVRSSGPGGQNVNKVATAVQLRFDVRGSSVLKEETQDALLRIAGSRATREGVLVIDARNHRKREQNREEARERLRDMVRRALLKPKPRRRTKPSRRAKQRRLDNKRKRSQVKSGRRSPRPDE